MSRRECKANDQLLQKTSSRRDDETKFITFRSHRDDGTYFNNMFAEVISIGDELTSGQRLDTNSQWLSLRLAELGVRTIYHTTVADDLEANIAVFRNAAARAEIIVASGGLGPTADDLTRAAVAAAAGLPLILDPTALAQIEALFTKRGRAMPERNRAQAEFPQGSRVIPNLHGTAPGIDLELPRAGQKTARLFCLPGVPAELREMWEQTVAPAIQQLVGPGRVIRHRVIKCFGAGESELEAMLPDLIRRGREPQVGITVSQATISLRITAHGPSAAACEQLIAPTAATIRECLGNLVYGEEEEELQEAALWLLGSQSGSLATAEWGTEGLLARWLRSAPGNEIHYAGGAALAGFDAVLRFLNDGSATGKREPSAPLSPEQIARSLAERCRELWGTDYGLAVGEAPQSAEGTSGEAARQTSIAAATAPPKIWFALAGPEKTIAIAQPFAGHPDLLVTRAAKQALNLLRLALLKVGR